MLTNSRFIWFMAMVLFFGVGLSGCQKYRAENSLKKTAQTLAEIEQKYGGLNHEPDRLNALKQSVARAQELLLSDASLALDTASQARTEAELLLESVRPKEAQVRLSRAEEEARVADINDLLRSDPNRYNRIREIINDARNANSQNKWDDVIRFADEAVREVETGLAPVKNLADRKALDAEAALTELRSNEGNRYAPEITVQVQDIINTARRILERDRDYQLATNRFDDAIQRADRGITLVRSDKSREALEQIEGFLATALIEGAETFKPKEYRELSERVVALTRSFKDGAFTTVLDGAKILSEEAQTLVIQTKRIAADERISNLSRAIDELDQGGVQEYLPGALDRARGNLTEMRQIRLEDQEAAFDRIKGIYVDADYEIEQVRNRFQNVAITRIRDGKGRLETTRGVFDQLQTIFEPLDGANTSEERVFEDQKRARQESIRGRLEETNVRIVTAELRQQEGKFREAIILAGEVSQLADQILSDIYHVVAHNASIELGKLISRYEREGARQYAPTELERSARKAEEVKSMIAARNFEQAVQQAAEARADVELMAQRIAGRATVDLREAERTLQSASSDNTRRFRSEMLAEVSSLIETARGHLQAQRLGLAVETANQATTLALRAETESNQLFADEAIQTASAALQQAQDAGAELYAGREVEDARRLISSARTLYATQDFVKAAELAQSSTTRARAGLFKKINEAEAEIANAIAVGGWEYSDTRLARANTEVREARALIESRNYSASRSKAETAASMAAAITREAKNANFRNQVASLRNNLREGSRSGVNFFQPEDAIEVRREIARLENTYNQDNYELTMVELKRLEARLRGTLDSTGDLVQTVAAQQEARLNRLVDNGAIQFASVEVKEAQDGLRFAILDYRRGLFKSAHSNLDRAIKLIDQIEGRRAQEIYSNQIQELFDRYRALQSGYENILSLEPHELKELAVGPNGAHQSLAISTQLSSSEFRKGVDQLFAEAIAIEAPASMRPIHEAAIQAFSEGRIAALNFEKLAILNRVAIGEANLLIDQAFIRMNNSNRLVTSVQRQLVSDEVRFRLVNNRASVLSR
jgi:hypothetical protein